MARFADQCIQAVGQEASPEKCVLLGTSEATRRRMKYWTTSAGDLSWPVKFDIRDLGGHLDVIRRARAGTHDCRAFKATSQVHLVGAFTLWVP